MKKSIIIVSLSITCITLSAFSFINWKKEKVPLKVENPKTQSCSNAINSCKKTEEKVKEKVNFHFGIGSRFSGISKSTLAKKESFMDFVTFDELRIISDVKSIDVILIVGDKQTDKRIFTEGNMLSIDQKNWIRNFDYSTNFLISADCIRKNYFTGKPEHSQYRPHLTVVPDYQAEYEVGIDSLISYLKENSIDDIKGVEPKTLTPAKIYFTIAKDGTIKNIKLSRTTGYPNIDQKMVELITNMPNRWRSAKNDRGESIDQELIFTFGIPGC